MYDITRQVLHQGTIRFIEVRFYFRATVAGVQESLALGSMYSLVDSDLEEHSYGALNVFKHGGEDSMVVINANSILSVVAMAPYKPEDGGCRFSSIEHPALGLIDPDNTLDVE